ADEGDERRRRFRLTAVFPCSPFRRQENVGQENEDFDMRSSHKVTIYALLLGGFALLGLAAAASKAQDQEERPTSRTMRRVIRGRNYAAASMKAEATRAAERVLEAGGNAFDAIVAGQAALAVVDAASNGVGSDAVILVYDARAKKVLSINAEGTAP